jgi:hypothetical protein
MTKPKSNVGRCTFIFCSTAHLSAFPAERFLADFHWSFPDRLHLRSTKTGRLVHRDLAAFYYKNAHELGLEACGEDGITILEISYSRAEFVRVAGIQDEDPDVMLFMGIEAASRKGLTNPATPDMLRVLNEVFNKWKSGTTWCEWR